MDINEYKTRTIPKYYSFMYLDGYSPNEILYAGGQEVIPKTFAHKDNTLFMGNYKEENALLKNLFFM